MVLESEWVWWLCGMRVKVGMKIRVTIRIGLGFGWAWVSDGVMVE